MGWFDVFCNNLERFWDRSLYFLPLFLVAILLSAGLSFLVGRCNGKAVVFFQLFFFSLVGIVVAYVETNLTSVVPSLLPSVLIVLAVLAQLVGGIRGEDSRPLKTSAAFAAAGISVFMFLVSAHYMKSFVKSPSPIATKISSVPESR